MPLPPYSPELNPMEDVWEFLRANKLSATVWDSYDDTLDACARAWNWLVHDTDRIKSIGTRDWATVNVQGSWYNCYENRMAGRSIMHRAHTADIRPATIFIHNGAPQALVGSQEGAAGGRSNARPPLRGSPTTTNRTHVVGRGR